MTDRERTLWDAGFSIFLGLASMPLIIWAVVDYVSNLPA